ncbi:sensor histidine kinase [Colwellia sp. D2M02]|uniref:sensor histidine kinase n=1 Tax=Colwellia sp. D2M02 TaxID=2841562 RepID=UPI001C08B4A3|nr:sensor histidine kinase [Colwellia sp. D2M02]
MSVKSSLERKLVLLFIFLALLPIIPCAYIISSAQLDWLSGFTLLLLMVLPSFWAANRCYSYVTDTLERIGLQLDALGNEEFNSWHLAEFNSGRVTHLKRDFEKLSKKLLSKRFEYMHNEAFLSEFIKELNLPILVLDHHQQIYSVNHAVKSLLNHANSHVIGQPVEKIGLVFTGNKWQQSHHALLEQRFEVTHHVLKRSGRNYQLLVLFSIEQQLRANEKQVWQRLIRVLNHEVRNSLTPIYSMTQSLQEMKLNAPLTPEQEKLEHNILQVIEKRSLQLLDFVENYSAFSKLAPAKVTAVYPQDIAQRMQAIFPTIVIDLNTATQVFYADAGQLEQGLINLIKNAFEACDGNDASAQVTMQWQQNEEQIYQSSQQNIEPKNQLKTTINIIDSGQGIANSDNLFVPFYSTKANGSGIGLIISREFIRNQGGELTLKNRGDMQGAIACINLTAVPTVMSKLK